MIITALSRKEALDAQDWLKASGYQYKGSYFWSEEWKKGDHVIYLHKGFNRNGGIESDWQKYVA